MDFPMQWYLELKGSNLNSQQVSVLLRRSRLCPAYSSTYQVSVGNLGRRVDHRLLWTKLRQQFGYLEERSLVYKDLKTPKNTLGRTQCPVRDGTLSQLCRLREQRSLDILLTFHGKGGQMGHEIPRILLRIILGSSCLLDYCDRVPCEKRSNIR